MVWMAGHAELSTYIDIGYARKHLHVNILTLELSFLLSKVSGHVTGRTCLPLGSDQNMKKVFKQLKLPAWPNPSLADEYCITLVVALIFKS